MALDIAFEIAHLKEVLELFSSEWVVSILPHCLRFLLWLLDIPENVVWKSSENLLLSSLRQTVSVGVLKVLYIVVLISLLENSKLLIENCGEVVDLEA